MTDLSLSIEKLKNVGQRNAPRLNRLGIKTLKDLLWHLPSKYEDYSETIPISDVSPGQKVNVQGEVVKITTKKIFPRRLFITDAIVKDMSGAVKAVWFNQPFIENQLPEGAFVSLAGKVKTGKNGVYLASPTYEKISSFQPTTLKHTHGLVPVYPETEGVTSKYLRFLIKPILSDLQLNDPTPESILKKHGFPTLSDAITTVHFPLSENEAKTARERLAFDDLMLFQIKALLERRKLNQLKSVPITFNEPLVKDFISALPFELTGDQKIAVWEILKDLGKKYPMNRLMEGDVGSGKTVVALIAGLEVAASGHQSVFLAPTEVLAYQHFKTISSLLNNSPVKVGLLTGSTAQINGEAISKKGLKERILNNEVGIVIGTHAVIQKDVEFKSLAFLIIDEQHRFGVSQRAHLIKNRGLVPHLLSMTATPIPRTLALTIYGDLDISIIREKPKNRQKIVTKIIGQNQRKSAYQFMREEVKKGKQIFVVCPRIEVSDPKSEIRTSGRQSKMNILWADVKAVEEEYKKLSQEIFPDLKIAMLHGKLKPKEKNRIMQEFKDSWHDILVSTSVIEVGVDVPNATIMAIESADRFGLAQLHQFRGRVGRDQHQSYCLLFSSSSDKTTSQRLKALTECDDGFELAEKDMAIRGPGEFMGTKQSGLPDLAMASLTNVELIKKARLEARLLLKEDPSLNKYPLLRERLAEFQKMTHFE
ncbi:MAG: ATP-dependent DNA helicase RecG [Candidatus Yanofskybacteria bacterium RIFCSPLOWO2_01_FULL_42_49]|uniref:ATP-dependent DNA helicase RecG n=1 Tax=Candidatus Yanofskybacteria bacterium RIFCSPLOWO2_01_FULL_42_49 TaxID=1802694 RepID=A0A1F8GCQ3_9BACT|nr:MAG: ATP-dependent DNA helicase RecG [Candidatus Yanofskybacteria bacterium RIFCSPLOWO2_01_FULL_42_49]